MREAKPGEPVRRRGRRWAPGVGVGLGLVILGLAVWLNLPGPRAAFDGGQMELLGVTRGVRHACPTAFPWERMAHLLPAGVLKHLPASGAPLPILERRWKLGLWLALPHAPPAGTEWYLETGTNSGPVVALRAFPVVQIRGRKVVQVLVDAWPRNAGSPRLVARRRFDSGWAPEPLGSIAVELPAVKPVAAWEAKPMPFTNAAPDASWRVAVDAFEHGWGRAAGHGMPRLETNRVPSGSAVRARMISDDPADRGWFLIAVRHATNTAGQVLEMAPSNWLSPRPGLMLTPGPWPGEPWNVLLEFSRNSHFQPEELVPLPPLVVGGPGENPIGWRTNVHGIQLEIRAVRNLPGPPNTVGLDVMASSVPEGWNVTLAGVKDSAGNPGWCQPRGGGLNATRMTFELRPPPGAGVVHATLAVHRSRMAVVTVEPTWGR